MIIQKSLSELVQGDVLHFWYGQAIVVDIPAPEYRYRKVLTVMNDSIMWLTDVSENAYQVTGQETPTERHLQLVQAYRQQWTAWDDTWQERLLSATAEDNEPAYLHKTTFRR